MENQTENEKVEVLESEAVTFYPDIQSVVDFLKKSGYRVARSSIYRHFNEGKIRRGPDGSFAQKEVLKYAKNFLKTIGGERFSSSKTANLQAEKLRAEVSKLQSQARIAEIRASVISGEYVPRADFENALAVRASYLKNDLNNFWYHHAPELCKIIAGDIDRVPDLITFGLEAVSDWLNRYCAPGLDLSSPPVINDKLLFEDDSDEETGPDD